MNFRDFYDMFHYTKYEKMQYAKMAQFFPTILNRKLFFVLYWHEEEFLKISSMTYNDIQENSKSYKIRNRTIN